jgi:hypothetical protein
MSVRGSVDGAFDDGFAMESVTLGGALEGRYRYESWQLSSSLGLAHTRHAPDETPEAESLFSLSAVGSRDWGRGITTSVKTDAFYSLAEPETSGYQRLVAAIIVGWRY